MRIGRGVATLAIGLKLLSACGGPPTGHVGSGGGAALTSTGGTGAATGGDTGVGGSGGVPVPTECNLPDCQDERHTCEICRVGDECSCPGGGACSWATDLDGDGYRVSLVGANGTEPGAYAVCSQVQFFDCDDTDPVHYYPGYYDLDGDGYAGERTCTFPGQDGVMQFLPSRFVSSPNLDCDDSDKAKNRTLYVDADGDGSGDPGQPRCEPAGAGLSADASDCDDQDPERPADLELWGDGLDSDCDGDDGTPRSDHCPIETPSLAAVCEGTNVVLLLECAENCWNGRILSIGNAGTLPVHGVATVSALALGGETEAVFEIAIDLAPAEKSAPFTVYIGPLSWLSLDLEAEECDASPNTLGQAPCNEP